MSGKVPMENMTQERIALLVRANEIDPSMSKSQLLHLVALLAGAAIECPRTECAYCEHQARSEQAKVLNVGEAEAG